MKTVIRISLLLLLVLFLSANGATLDNTHLFQGHMRDASVITSMYVLGDLDFDIYEHFNRLSIGASGFYPVNEQIEIGAKLSFVSWMPDDYDSESGISDLIVTGKYNVLEGDVNVSTGVYLTLPIGEEKVGYGNLDFGVFGAMRYGLASGHLITANLGIDFIETTTYEWDGTELKEKTKYENSILLGGGAILSLNEQFSVIPELQIRTEFDYLMLSGGVDYKLDSGARVRGMLGLGLDDGTPDFRISAGFLFPF